MASGRSPPMRQDSSRAASCDSEKGFLAKYLDTSVHAPETQTQSALRVWSQSVTAIGPKLWQANGGSTVVALANLRLPADPRWRRHRRLRPMRKRMPLG